MNGWRDKLHRHPRLVEAIHAALMVYRRRRYSLRNVHRTFYLGGRGRISPDLVAGPYSVVAMDCVIGPKVTLGPYAMVASEVVVTGGDHRFDIPGIPMVYAGRPEIRETVVEADAWIGYRAILLTGVHVGRGAIVGAGAVVTHNIPPYEIYAGVPARKVGERFANSTERAEHDAMLARAPFPGRKCGPLGIAHGPALLSHQRSTESDR